MSDITRKPEGGAPDPDVQELAARQNIPLEEAERLIRERGNDPAVVDAAAQREKLRDAP
ncbi:hypothetical protein [Aureimonas endophytica]|nr:hypothetical protein [Aureimonas endophytica]